jgi:hypothetical protein
MSWLFSQALVEEYLGDTCLDGEPSAPLSGNNTQQAYCAPDKMTKFSRLSRFGMTYKPLTETRGEELLTLYLEDFHARTSAQPAKAQELKETNPQCGNTWQGSLARLDPSTSLWRTAQCSLLEDLELSLQTFPRWGLMQNGALYQLPTLVQTISVKEFGSEPNNETFFHTPTTTGLDGGSNSRKALKKRKNTNQYVTPTARDYKGMGGAGFRLRHGMNHNLADCLGGVPNPMFVEWLMAWPLGWTDLKPLVMDKSLYAPQLHGSYLNE